MSSIVLSETIIIIGVSETGESGDQKPWTGIGVSETKSWELETFHRGIRNRASEKICVIQYDGPTFNRLNTIFNTYI